MVEDLSCPLPLKALPTINRSAGRSYLLLITTALLCITTNISRMRAGNSISRSDLILICTAFWNANLKKNLPDKLQIPLLKSLQICHNLIPGADPGVGLRRFQPPPRLRSPKYTVSRVACSLTPPPPPPHKCSCRLTIPSSLKSRIRPWIHMYIFRSPAKRRLWLLDELFPKKISFIYSL